MSEAPSSATATPPGEYDGFVFSAWGYRTLGTNVRWAQLLQQAGTLLMNPRCWLALCDSRWDDRLTKPPNLILATETDRKQINPRHYSLEESPESVLLLVRNEMDREQAKGNVSVLRYMWFVALEAADWFHGAASYKSTEASTGGSQADKADFRAFELQKIRDGASPCPNPSDHLTCICPPDSAVWHQPAAKSNQLESSAMGSCPAGPTALPLTSTPDIEKSSKIASSEEGKRLSALPGAVWRCVPRLFRLSRRCFMALTDGLRADALRADGGGWRATSPAFLPTYCASLGMTLSSFPPVLRPAASSHVFYSQTTQDHYLFQKYFRGQAGPSNVFVDIGAHDGRTFNNSLFFEEALGWTGICVEPQPDQAARLRRNRRCHVFDGCVARQSGSAEFVHVEGHANMLSGLATTASDEQRERIDKEIQMFGGRKTSIVRETLTFNDLCDRFGIRTVDYLSIDTEGSELDIIAGIDFKRNPVHALTVENNNSEAPLRNLLAERGFKFITRIGQDDLFVDETYESRSKTNLTRTGTLKIGAFAQSKEQDASAQNKGQDAKLAASFSTLQIHPSHPSSAAPAPPQPGPSVSPSDVPSKTNGNDRENPAPVPAQDLTRDERLSRSMMSKETAVSADTRAERHRLRRAQHMEQHTLT